MSSSLELPPIKDAGVALPASSSSAAVDASLSSPGCSDGALRLVGPGLRAHMERFEALSDSYGTAVSDMDHIKRHVGKLSGLRRDTSHIEEMLADGVSGRRWHVEIAGVMQRKHEAELQEQAKYYEQQMKDMRKTMELEFERRLEEHLAAQNGEYSDSLQRLREQGEKLCSTVTAHTDHLRQVVSATASPPVDTAGQSSAIDANLGTKALAEEAEAALNQASSALDEVEPLLEAAQERMQGLRRLDYLTSRHELLVPNYIRAKAHHCMQVALIGWFIAVKDARNEASHRYQAFEVEASHSAELCKMQKDLQRATVELRKQRRVHGIAAVHANMDKRLQALLYAWSSITQESQREAAFRRQLDIAAAESAAGYAVIRMEGRRRQRELQSQRQMQALRAVEAERICAEHVVLRAWLEVIAKVRHDRGLARYFETQVAAGRTLPQLPGLQASEALCTESMRTILVEWLSVAARSRTEEQTGEGVQDIKKGES